MPQLPFKGGMMLPLPQEPAFSVGGFFARHPLEPDHLDPAFSVPAGLAAGRCFWPPPERGFSYIAKTLENRRPIFKAGKARHNLLKKRPAWQKPDRPFFRQAEPSGNHL